MVVLIVNFKFQRMNPMSDYTYPEKSSIVRFSNVDLISNESIISVLKEEEMQINGYKGSGYELLNIKIIESDKGQIIQ